MDTETFEGSQTETTSKDRTDHADAWLGTQLRALRAARGLSIRKLANKAGVSVGLVSQIENGVTSPSIKSLRQISEALGVPVRAFFDEPAQPPTAEMGVIVRAPQRRLLNLRTKGVLKELLTPDLTGDLEVLMVHVAPGGSSGPEMYTHPGEEAGYILEGTMALFVENNEFNLEAEDAFRFKSTRPHRFENAGTTDLKLIWVISPPIY